MLSVRIRFLWPIGLLGPMVFIPMRRCGMGFGLAILIGGSLGSFVIIGIGFFAVLLLDLVFQAIVRFAMRFCFICLIILVMD
jgi:hypothetical protein